MFRAQSCKNTIDASLTERKMMNQISMDIFNVPLEVTAKFWLHCQMIASSFVIIISANFAA